MKKITLIMLITVFAISCGGGTHYVDPSRDRGSATWGPREIKSTVELMVNSMYTYLKDDWGKPAIIEHRPIRNRTSEHIDTNMVSNEIVTNLVKKRIQFIDASITQDAIDEIGLGMTGLIDSEYAIPIGELRSPNFYLQGEISDNMRYVGRQQVQYLVVTLRLSELRTRSLVWQDQKEFLKVSPTRKTGL